MSLTVLTDDQVKDLLENLTLEELEGFRHTLKSALHDYSTGTQSMGDGDVHQPHRTSITSASTGATTLFMPSCSPAGVGMKVITLSPPQDISPAAKPVIRPTGAITLFSPTGGPVGFLHASTLTAFRTALSSACLLVRRRTVHSIAVFGCGEQAYWHVRLALMFRGATVRHVNIINRRFSDACRAILHRFYSVPPAVKAREGWTDAQFSVLTPGYGEFDRLQREHLRSADVVFCCTPSTEPLFDAAILTSHEARRKGRLVVAIGSYTPLMRELPTDLLRQAVRGNRNHDAGGSRRHYHKHALEGGVIVVDTLDGALKEAGEIIEAGLAPTQLVELGELVMLNRISQQGLDDESADDVSSTTTATSSSGTGTGTGTGTGAGASFPSSPDLERQLLEGLSLTPTPGTPAMSTVFGGDSSSLLSGTTAGGGSGNNTNNNNNGGGGGGGKSPSSRRSSPVRSLFRARSSSRTRARTPTGAAAATATATAAAVRSSSQSSVDRESRPGKQQKPAGSGGGAGSGSGDGNDHLARWLEKGNVIYKSVGLGLMDLSVGMHLVRFAQEKGVGSQIAGF